MEAGRGEMGSGERETSHCIHFDTFYILNPEFIKLFSIFYLRKLYHTIMIYILFEVIS